MQSSSTRSDSWLLGHGISKKTRTLYIFEGMAVRFKGMGTRFEDMAPGFGGVRAWRSAMQKVPSWNTDEEERKRLHLKVLFKIKCADHIKM